MSFNINKFAVFMRTAFLFIFLSVYSLGLAQNEHLSSFSSVTLTYKIHPKFFLYGEGQLRAIEDYSVPDYYELKGGVGYYLSANHKPFIGLGRYANYKNRELSKEEFRVWLQDIIDVKKGVVKFENRFRAEKSWFYEPQKDLNSGRTRFRYRLNISVPLNREKIEPGTVFANTYDELFFTPSKTEPVFSRNRLYGGIGYQVDENFGLASGYLWQREFASAGNRNLHFIYLALNINIDGTDDDRDYNFPGAD